jgi:hypothetical protein
MERDMTIKEFILWLLCLVGAVLACFWIITTYTATSELLGSLNSTSSNLVFCIQTQTVVMTQEDGDKYSTTKEFSSVYQVDSTFDADKNSYEFILNNTCFASTEMEAGKVSCDLTTTFLNTDGSDLFTDTLYISLDFYSDKTVLNIYTLGGQTANAYWLSYFNSYGFDMRVYNLGGK